MLRTLPHKFNCHFYISLNYLRQSIASYGNKLGRDDVIDNTFGITSSKAISVAPPPSQTHVEKAAIVTIFAIQKTETFPAKNKMQGPKLLNTTAAAITAYDHHHQSIIIITTTRGMGSRID